MLFIDEIHRLNRAVEEILYPALEDFRLDIVFGQGAAARTLTIDLPPFTLVGATTRSGLLTTPLRDRFGMTFRLGYYEPGRARHDRAPLGRHPRRRDRGRRGRRDRAPLARHAADREPDPAARARRRRGAPRRHDHDRRRPRGARAARGRRQGLERIDRELLRPSREKFGGGPVGLSTLAVALGEEPDTIEDVYEPYLLQLGFLQRTPRGRIITELGRAHIGRRPRRRQPLLSMPELWTPGMTARSTSSSRGSSARIEAFRVEHGLEQVAVRVELADGALHRLASISPEPGFGFVTLCPHREDGEPEEMIVPLGAMREIRIGRAEDEQRLGFAPAGASRRPALAPELQCVPARHGRELEQRPAALRLGVAEIARALVPPRPRAGPP